MEVNERRRRIIQILCVRRYESISNLARDLGVSTRTIQRDISIISLYEPIITKQGKYGGGVYIMKGYYGRYGFMNNEDISLLIKIRRFIVDKNEFDEDELSRLDTIIELYRNPIINKRN